MLQRIVVSLQEVKRTDMKRDIIGKIIVAVGLLLWAAALPARQADGAGKISYPGGRCRLYRVNLANKQGCPFSLARPEEFLSPRAVERRRRQRLVVDSTDLPVSPVYVQAVRERGLDVVGRSKWNNTLLVRVASEKQLARLKELPFVVRMTKVFTAPDSVDKRVRSSFHKEFNKWDSSTADEYGSTREQIDNLNGRRLHTAGFRGEGKMIAVLDGGFMNTDRIPALHEVKIAGCADFVVPRSGNMFQEMEHGTMVLSVLAARVPHYYIGTAPEATYVLVRCEDEQTESLAEEDYWAAAVEYADSLGADVINSSLGYHGFDDRSTDHTYSQLDGEQSFISHTASMLAGKGIVLVNSAGNDGMGTWKKINCPADARDILTVGSISPNGVNAPFSAVGPTADGRVKPDVMAFGSPTSVITGRGSIINDIGTSFSAPLIAGMVACLWQALPDKTALEIEDLVRRSGHNYAHPDNVYGYGLPDFWSAYVNGRGEKTKK